MATISDRLCPHFNGQVGPVVFRNGTGQSDDPDVLAYFHDDSDRYDVTDDYDHDDRASLEAEVRELAAVVARETGSSEAAALAEFGLEDEITDSPED